MPDFTNFKAVVAFAQDMVRRYPRFTQYVYQVPGRSNYNITMQKEHIEKQGGTLLVTVNKRA